MARRTKVASEPATVARRRTRQAQHAAQSEKAGRKSTRAREPQGSARMNTQVSILPPCRRGPQRPGQPTRTVLTGASQRTTPAQAGESHWRKPVNTPPRMVRPRSVLRHPNGCQYGAHKSAVGRESEGQRTLTPAWSPSEASPQGLQRKGRSRVERPASRKGKRARSSETGALNFD